MGLPELKPRGLYSTYKTFQKIYILPGSYIRRGHYRLPWPSKQARQIKSFIPISLDVIAELDYDYVGHRVSVTLGAAFRISLRAANPQDVNRTAVSSEEAAVVVTVGVDSAEEAFSRT